MMIDDPVLKAHHDALAFLEDALRRVHLNRDKYHPTQYRAMMAEPLVDEICKIRAEIDRYIGLTEFATSSQMHNPMQIVPELEGNRQPPDLNGELTSIASGAGAPASTNGHP